MGRQRQPRRALSPGPPPRPARPPAGPAATDSMVSGAAGSRATTSKPAAARSARAAGQGSSRANGTRRTWPTETRTARRYSGSQTGGVEQYRPGAEGGGVAEDGAHVLVVVDALDDHGRRGAGQHDRHRGRAGARPGPARPGAPGSRRSGRRRPGRPRTRARPRRSAAATTSASASTRSGRSSRESNGHGDASNWRTARAPSTTKTPWLAFDRRRRSASRRPQYERRLLGSSGSVIAIGTDPASDAPR